ncbi:uncharacterized protein LOC102805703 [Saccoglossus kowalevskii]|uniref:Uncharacterized protein LOC102805703 isoform X1 n=1 Tax=Saccoglossus kowalevskii TaxID=10224 RepID=A0ABM0MRX8_SACKO|nr:PREDICTED: uncharacterized protein LOC102805703 isoform X1 [Saccoglossus kowalevskii]XP_006822769.1 PREDICTED: uncharacterized protein LOC102805703 isoform X2 [Saccoglossus kowalevskii]
MSTMSGRLLSVCTSIGYHILLMLYLASQCSSIPLGPARLSDIEHKRGQAYTVTTTQHPKHLIQYLQDLVNMNDGQDPFFSFPTNQPPPKIPTYPEIQENVNNLPNFIPTYSPFGPFEVTYEPTAYNDNSFYGNSVTSSSFIAVAIAIVVILIISIVVTIYAIKGRRRNIIIMTIRRNGRMLDREGEYFQTLADGDRSLLVQPAPIVYMQDGQASTPPTQVPEPPPYTEHEQGETLLPNEMPPPYTEASGSSTDNQPCD